MQLKNKKRRAPRRPSVLTIYMHPDVRMRRSPGDAEQTYQVNSTKALMRLAESSTANLKLPTFPNVVPSVYF
jgi:hypothetical protein